MNQIPQIQATTVLSDETFSFNKIDERFSFDKTDETFSFNKAAHWRAAVAKQLIGGRLLLPELNALNKFYVLIN